MTKKAKSVTSEQPNNTLILEQSGDETGGQALARKLLEPDLRHAATASAFVGKILGSKVEAPSVLDFVGPVQRAASKAEGGDMAIASRLLTAQAITLDSMFTELARRAALNIGEYVNAAELFGRLALKAQSNCRATLEALAKLHQPREQTVRHVHVNDGGQAIVANQFHQHTGGIENGKAVKQSHAPGALGTCAALPGKDASGAGLPVTGSEREAAVPNARRHESGAT